MVFGKRLFKRARLNRGGKMSSYYSDPAARRRVGKKASVFEQLDVELADTDAVKDFARELIASLPSGKAILSGAESRRKVLGRIPTIALSKLRQLNWMPRNQDHLAHLQLIWRYHLVFENRRLLKAMQTELETQAKLSHLMFEYLLSDLRGAQQTLYRSLESQGMNPYGLDQMLDRQNDLIEGMLAIRLWQLLLAEQTKDALVREGLGQWELAMRREALDMSDDLLRIGSRQALSNDLALLQHGIHDTKIKYIVLLATAATHPEISTESLVRLFAGFVSSGLAPWTGEQLVGALQFASQRSQSSKIDAAAARSAEILSRSQDSLEVGSTIGSDWGTSAGDSTQASTDDACIVGITLDNQAFVDFLGRLLTTCLELFRGSENSYRREKAMQIHTALVKLEQVDVAQHGAFEILLTREEVGALILAWDRFIEGEITPVQVPGHRKFSSIMGALSMDLSSLYWSEPQAIGLHMVRPLK